MSRGGARTAQAAIRLWIRHPEWTDRAACRQADPELFFPESSAKDASDPALLFCNGCEVITECHEAGQTEEWGVWGGVPEGVKREETAHAAPQRARPPTQPADREAGQVPGANGRPVTVPEAALADRGSGR